jgi:hypothetical protein
MRSLAAFPSCVLAGALCWCAASVAQAPAVRVVAPVDESRLVTLTGNTHPLARARHDRGRVSPDLPMGDLVLVLRRSPEQQAAFDRFLAAQYDFVSPDYHHWLDPEEVGERFGPAQSDVDVVSNWLRGHGFTIDEVTSDRLSIRFSGTAAQVETTFHTQIHNLDVRGEKHIANMTDPQVPAAFAPVVVGVKALHNFFPKPLHRLGAQVRFNRETGTWQRIDAAGATGLEPDPTQPHPGAHALFSSTDPYGNLIEDVSPYDFATIYNVLPLWKAARPIDGYGQTIAIAGTSNINLADVASFRSAFSLPAKVPTVIVTNSDPGQCLTLAPSCYGNLIENSLDVEWSGAVAKGASIVLVTSSAPTASTDPLYLSESYIVQHKTAPVMNVSYGECELELGNAGNAEYANLWSTAATEGIAVFVASGDSGSASCDQGEDAYFGVPYAAQYGLSVSGLASTPYNTAVGGTDLNWGSTAAPYWSATNSSPTKASALGYIPEVPWDSTCTNPLVLPDLEGDASYLGISGVVDAESACNFLLDDQSYIATNFGIGLAWLVDTIGGAGGVSACTDSNMGYVDTCSGGYAQPVWQANVPGIPNNGLRNLPDVSFFASNGFLGSSYLICVSAGGNTCAYSPTTESIAQEVGGTSVASPAMAGVMALINQKAGAAQGSPNTLLYAMATRQTWSACSAESVTASSSCFFNDIDEGTNAMPCVNGAYSSGETFNCNILNPADPIGIQSGYTAASGYDLVTGLGSLNVANVVNTWPLATTPIASLSPFSLTFASTEVGAKSAVQALILKNTGKTALTLNGTGQGISVFGANDTSFSQNNNCGASLAAAASCTISVTFKPLVAGALNAKIKLVDNAWESPQYVSIKGTATPAAPAVTLGTTSLSFGLTGIGGTNASPPLTLTNSGLAPLKLTGVSITGTNASSFSVTNTCGTSVATGASCTFTVTFKPMASGPLSAAVSFADNAPGSPQTVAISGTGTAASLSAIGLFFAPTTVGKAAPTAAVTLTNKGATALSLSGTAFGITITGPNSTSFSQSNNCGTSVAPAASCTITATFKPVANGALTATINIVDNAYGSPQTVSLSGTGQ